MTHGNKWREYNRIEPPSEGRTSSWTAFIYLLGFCSLLMFAIGFFGLPMPWLMSLFG